MFKVLQPHSRTILAKVTPPRFLLSFSFRAVGPTSNNILTKMGRVGVDCFLLKLFAVHIFIVIFGFSIPMSSNKPNIDI